MSILATTCWNRARVLAIAALCYAFALSGIAGSFFTFPLPQQGFGMLCSGGTEPLPADEPMTAHCALACLAGIASAGAPQTAVATLMLPRADFGKTLLIMFEKDRQPPKQRLLRQAPRAPPAQA